MSAKTTETISTTPVCRNESPASKADALALSADIRCLETVIIQSNKTIILRIVATMLGFGAIQTALIVGAFMLLTRTSG